jgi:hypothetical protein
VPIIRPIGPAVWPPIANDTGQDYTTQDRTEAILEKNNIDIHVYMVIMVVS